MCKTHTFNLFFCISFAKANYYNIIVFPFKAMGPDGYTSKEVVYCPDLRESSNRFGICSVKKPRTLSWINTERLRSENF